jgi:hypothetical protein
VTHNSTGQWPLDHINNGASSEYLITPRYCSAGRWLCIFRYICELALRSESILTDESSSFNDDQIGLMAYESSLDRSPYLLLRVINTEIGGAWFSLRGFHELCIEREGSSLLLKRWSQSAHASKTWAILNFKTWEGSSACLVPL